MKKKIYLLMAILMAGWIIPVEAKAPDSSTKEKPAFKIGGALRFNYNYSDWKSGCRKRGGDFGFDVFRLKMLPAVNSYFQPTIVFILLLREEEC